MISKLVLKLTTFAGVAQQAISKGCSNWTSFTYTYYGQVQTMLLHSSGRMVIMAGNAIQNGWKFGGQKAIIAFLTHPARGLADSVVRAAVIAIGVKKP